MPIVQENQAPAVPPSSGLNAALRSNASLPGHHDAVVWIFMTAGAAAAVASQTSWINPLLGYAIGGALAFLVAGLILAIRS